MRGPAIILVLLFQFWVSKAFGHVKTLGHNLTPTTYTLSKGEITAGTYALGYGLTDELSIGTSPWLAYDYNMPMVQMKYGTPGFWEGSRIAADLNYFKTYPYGENLYDMKAAMTRLGASYDVSSPYTLHAVLGIAYYWNDAKPFSLRLSPRNRDRYTLSLSTLHETRLTGNFGIMTELGMLGLNYLHPYLHWGTSLFVKWSFGYLQVGVSHSITRFRESLDYGGGSFELTDEVYHPEIQLQFFL